MLEKSTVKSQLTQSAISAGASFLGMATMLQEQGVDPRNDPSLATIWAGLERIFAPEKHIIVPQSAIDLTKPSVNVAKQASQPQFNKNPQTSQLVAPAIVTTHMSIFDELQFAVHRSAHPHEHFPIGTIIPDTWTDTTINERYDMPFVVASYRKFEGVDDLVTRLGVVLLRQIATPFLVQFDAPEVDRNLRDSRHLYGYNRYWYSNIRQWLNSRDAAGSWWRKQHDCDAPPEIAQSKDGYLRGCTEELLKVVTPVILQVPHTDNIWRGTPDLIGASFFLPSVGELGFSFIDNGFDAPWRYFGPHDDELNQSRRFFRDPSGVVQTCLTRSAYHNTTDGVFVATTDGFVSYSHACTTGACAPACVIA